MDDTGQPLDGAGRSSVVVFVWGENALAFRVCGTVSLRQGKRLRQPRRCTVGASNDASHARGRRAGCFVRGNPTTLHAVAYKTVKGIDVFESVAKNPGVPCKTAMSISPASAAAIGYGVATVPITL